MPSPRIGFLAETENGIPRNSTVAPLNPNPERQIWAAPVVFQVFWWHYHHVRRKHPIGGIRVCCGWTSWVDTQAALEGTIRTHRWRLHRYTSAPTFPNQTRKICVIHVPAIESMFPNTGTCQILQALLQVTTSTSLTVEVEPASCAPKYYQSSSLSDRKREKGRLERICKILGLHFLVPALKCIASSLSSWPLEKEKTSGIVTSRFSIFTEIWDDIASGITTSAVTEWPRRLQGMFPQTVCSFAFLLFTLFHSFS